MFKFFLEITLLFFIICLISIFLARQGQVLGHQVYQKGDLYAYCPKDAGYGYWYRPVGGRKLIDYKWRWFYAHQFVALMNESEYASCLNSRSCPFC